jgi:hypothetical protein
MRRNVLFLVVSTWFFASVLAAAQPADVIEKASDKNKEKKQGTTRIGEIIIIGAKADDAIRKAAGLFPGQALDGVAIQKAEKSLAAFDATVMVMDTKDPGFKDILIKVKSKLDQLIAEALKNNPDIRVAEAKARESEAQLQRARMKVAADITILHAEIEAAKAGLEEGHDRYKRAISLYPKSMSKEDFASATLTYLKLKTELASAEAKLPYLLGKQPASIHSRIEVWFKPDRWPDSIVLLNGANAVSPTELLRYQSDRLKAVQSLADIGSPMTDKLRKALDAPMTFPRAESDLADLMEYVRDKGLDVNIIIRLKLIKKEKLKVKLERPIPLGAFLQFVEDEIGVVFVLREYGIVVVAADERLPPGAIRVVDFWKHGKPAEPKAETKDKK